MIRARVWENNKLAIQVFFLLMFVWGVVMSFMIPPWQTPDEYAHLNMIGYGFKNEHMAGNLIQDMDLDNGRLRFQYNEKINVDAWKAAMLKAPTYDRESCLPHGISLSVVKHLPASMGILLGILLGLPAFWVLELGELFSLIFSIVLCRLSVELMPKKKETLLLIMAFPMTIQQISSINYDSVLLPLCFLYISYLFYLRWEKERLGWKEAGITILLLLLITYIKLPYLFLGLLAFILPKEKIYLKVGRLVINKEVIKKWRVPAGVFLLLLSVGLMYLVRDNFWVRLVAGMALEWKRSLHLFAATAATWWKYLMVSSVGQFGWLEAALPFGFVIFSYFLLLTLAVWGEEGEAGFVLTKKTRIYLWIVFFVLSGFTVMSMVNHTITVMLYGAENAVTDYNVREALHQIPYIGGLQGRYFLPFLVLPFLALPGWKSQIKWKLWLAVGYIPIAMGITSLVLYKRYWI